MTRKLKTGASATALVLALVLASGGCSVEKLALKKVAGMLTGPSGADVFSSDNDPDFVGQALPFPGIGSEVDLELVHGRGPIAQRGVHDGGEVR